MRLLHSSSFEQYNGRINGIYRYKSQRVSRSMAEMVDVTKYDMNDTVTERNVQVETEGNGKRSVQDKLKHEGKSMVGREKNEFRLIEQSGQRITCVAGIGRYFKKRICNFSTRCIKYVVHFAEVAVQEGWTYASDRYVNITVVRSGFIPGSLSRQLRVFPRMESSTEMRVHM